MRRRGRARRNPSDPDVTYAIVLAMFLAAAGAAWGWKHATDKQRKEVLGI